MIRLANANARQALTLPEACKWIGQRTGKTPATSTAWRWVLRGVRGGIRLEVFRLGGTTYTTPDFIERFMEATTGTVKVESATAATTPVETVEHETRRREIAAAQEQLRQLCQSKRDRRRAKPEHDSATD